MVPEEDSRYKVDLFWNLEESMVTRDEANEIARRMTDSLRTINKQYYLGKMYAVGSSTLDSVKEVSEELELNGFKMKEAPTRMVPCCVSGCDNLVRKQGVADRVILQLLLREVLKKDDDGLSKNVMIVSDNPDLKLTVGILKNQGYKLFIAAKWSDSTSDYQLSGDHLFEWEEMKVGTAYEIPQASGFSLVTNSVV